MKGGMGQVGRGLGLGAPCPVVLGRAALPVPCVLTGWEALLSCVPRVFIGVPSLGSAGGQSPRIALSLQLLCFPCGLAAESAGPVITSSSDRCPS